MEMKECLYPKESRLYKACGLCSQRTICEFRENAEDTHTEEFFNLIYADVPLTIDRRRFIQYLSSGNGIYKIHIENIDNLSENTLKELYMFWIESLIQNEYKNVEGDNQNGDVH